MAGPVDGDQLIEQVRVGFQRRSQQASGYDPGRCRSERLLRVEVVIQALIAGGIGGLIVALINNAVQSKVAMQNRLSAERQAEAKAENDRLLAFRGRLFEPRAETYLSAYELLAKMADEASRAGDAGFVATD